jgi:hydrogenase maturation protease
MRLVVGVGQPYAGDDGVGRAVARRLRELGVPAAEAADGAELLERLAGATRAVVVDAAVGAGAPGTVLEVAPEALPRDAAPLSSHGLSVGDAVRLARALDAGLEVRVVAVAIAPPAAGPGLSPAVAAAVETAAARARSLLE